MNAMGDPIDGKGPIMDVREQYPIHREPPPALERRRIQALW